MTTSEIATLAATWTPQKRAVARWLAIGQSAMVASRHTDVPHRTVQRWAADNTFDAYVQELRAYCWREVEPSIMSMVVAAVSLLTQMYNGEISPKDGRIAPAERLVNRILDRFAAAEAPSAAPGPAGPQVAVTIHQPPPERTGRIIAGELVDAAPASYSASD